MKKMYIPRLGQTIDPDKERIKEINEAIKEKSGDKAKKLLFKYEQEREWKEILEDLLR